MTSIGQEIAKKHLNAFVKLFLEAQSNRVSTSRLSRQSHIGGCFGGVGGVFGGMFGRFLVLKTQKTSKQNTPKHIKPTLKNPFEEAY